MSNEEKLSLLEDVLELDEGVLQPDIELENIDGWDSMAKIALVSLMDDEFDRKLTGEQIKGFKTVQDILNFMD